MLSPDATLVALVALDWTLASCVLGLAITLATEPDQWPTDGGDRVAGPVTAPILLGDLHGHTSTVALPSPRRYTPSTGLPTLVVDSPPGTRGLVPVDIVDLPLAFRPSCSYCLDGTVVIAQSGACPWCNRQAVTA